MHPALRVLHEATRLLANNHPDGAIVFAASANELFLKTAILQPLVYGLVHNDSMATILVDYTLAHTGFERYDKLLVHVFREVAAIDISIVQRIGGTKPLPEECKELGKRRNCILHRGDTFTYEEAVAACEIVEAVYLQLVEPMLKALDLYIFRDGTICRTPYRTTKDHNGYRVIAHSVTFTKDGMLGSEGLADGTIPVPPQ
jgi:hypothetical protein